MAFKGIKSVPWSLQKATLTSPQTYEKSVFKAALTKISYCYREAFLRAEVLNLDCTFQSQKSFRTTYVWGPSPESDLDHLCASCSWEFNIFPRLFSSTARAEIHEYRG